MVGVSKKVFISGPIHGVEDRQGYRAKISSLLTKYGYEPVDPWEREKVIYRACLGRWPCDRALLSDLIEGDLRDIDGCYALIAYLPRLSAGTCMELFYAKLKGKKTITICKIRNPSPWIIYHSDIIVRNFNELEAVLKSGV